jgi:hypothetical protein
MNHEILRIIWLALKIEHLYSAGGYLHAVNGKGGKQRACVIPRHALETLDAYLQGRESGYVFDGRHMGHILHEADPEAA